MVKVGPAAAKVRPALDHVRCGGGEEVAQPWRLFGHEQRQRRAQRAKVRQRLAALERRQLYGARAGLALAAIASTSAASSLSSTGAAQLGLELSEEVDGDDRTEAVRHDTQWQRAAVAARLRDGERGERVPQHLVQRGAVGGYRVQHRVEQRLTHLEVLEAVRAVLVGRVELGGGRAPGARVRAQRRADVDSRPQQVGGELCLEALLEVGHERRPILVQPRAHDKQQRHLLLLPHRPCGDRRGVVH
eukprot:scaffold79739_cov39-Phaeocystis_antarctica.AAC.1